MLTVLMVSKTAEPDKGECFFWRDSGYQQDVFHELQA